MYACASGVCYDVCICMFIIRLLPIHDNNNNNNDLYL